MILTAKEARKLRDVAVAELFDKQRLELEKTIIPAIHSKIYKTSLKGEDCLHLDKQQYSQDVLRVLRKYFRGKGYTWYEVGTNIWVSW